MKLARELMGSLRVGLLGLLLVAAAVEARTSFDEAGVLSTGIRGGAILADSDLDGAVSGQGGLFVRYGILQGLQAELGVEYGRYSTEDDRWVLDPATGALVRDPSVSDEDYYTHLSSAQLRLLWAPVLKENWAPYLYGGVGYFYYNVEDLTPRRGDWDGIGSTMGFPLGIGAWYSLGERLGLEASAGYTFTLSDKIDESDDGSGNDNYLNVLVGVTYDIRLGEAAPARRRAPQRPAPVPAPAPQPRPAAPEVAPSPQAPVDQDGDGLTDQEERTQYFTNPLMADSDGDGLEDGAEVKMYGTNPNKADTDGGSVNDGEEIDRGSDPLDPADDVVEQPPEQVMPTVQYEFPVVLFPAGGDQLSSAARTALDQAAQVLRENRGLLLEVAGHTDDSGYAPDNEKLSRSRAQAVKDYLVSQGVAAWRIVVKAYGASQPVADNDTPEGRRSNRRVELHVR